MSKKVHAFSNDALGHLDAVGIAEALSKKEISALEVTEAAIQRAEKIDPQLGAIVYKCYDTARINANHVSGYFGGIPTFVKDNENMKGIPTQFGTKAFQAKPAKKNSRFVNQFIATGLNVIGKTTLPEFGLICSTENPKWGITRNPWNTDYTPGGSSSGSAAMVAAGVVPIAMANDGAGSTRIPASCTGLVGLKPSRNRLMNFEGSDALPINIGYEGVLTRSVRDTIAFYQAAEQYYKNEKLPPIGNNIYPTNSKLRIAYFENLPEGKMGHQDADTEASVAKSVKILGNLGHSVTCLPFPIDIDFMSQHFLRYYGFLAFLLKDLSRIALNAKMQKEELENFTTGLSKQFTANITQLPSSLKLLKKIGAETEHAFNDFDVILTPVVSHVVPPIGYFDPTIPYEEICRRAVSFASYTGLQNITGSPAIAIPMSNSKQELPIGVQLTAPLGQDRLLLELALQVEQANPFKKIYE